MIRLWQDPLDDMYIKTVGDIEQLPKDEDEDLYRCTPTRWCETIEEALTIYTVGAKHSSVRELGTYNLIAQGETIDELKLMMLLEN